MPLQWTNMSIYEQSLLKQVIKIIGPHYVLNDELQLLPSGRRYRVHKHRLQHSFIPSCIRAQQPALVVFLSDFILFYLDCIGFCFYPTLLLFVLHVAIIYFTWHTCTSWNFVLLSTLRTQVKFLLWRQIVLYRLPLLWTKWNEGTKGNHTCLNLSLPSCPWFINGYTQCQS